MADPRLVDFVSGRYAKNSGQVVNVAHAWDWKPLTQSDLTTADSDKALTVPAGKQWLFQSLRVELITVSSTAVAGSTSSRQLELQVRSTSDDILFSALAGVVQPNSSTRFYNLGPDLTDLTTFRDADQLSTPFPAVTLPSGYDIRIFDNKTRHTTGDDMVVHLHVLERDNPTT